MPPNKMLIYKGEKGNFTWRKFIRLISNGTHGNGATEQMHWRSPAPTLGFLPKMHNLNREDSESGPFAVRTILEQTAIPEWGLPVIR